jgi:hypothetical protein
MKKDKKVTVDVDLTFIKCPINKKHSDTVLIVGDAFDGFIRPGCICSGKVILEALEIAEKSNKNKARKKAKK